MPMLDEEGGADRRKGYRGKVPKYARMPRAGRVIIDPAKLRYWRHVRVMTRQQLAEAARLSVFTVRSYEQGLRFPRESAFRRLFIALGVPPQDLLFDDCKYVRKKEKLWETSARRRRGSSLSRCPRNSR